MWLNGKEAYLDEKKLIEKAKEGHNLSMNYLLEENYKLLYRYMLKMTGNEEITKDMVQETMIKAVSNIKKFRGDSKFSSWLIRIGINTYKNYMKKNKALTELLEPYVACSESLEGQVEKKEQLRAIVKRLCEVKEPDRSIFILKYYEGYDYKEIAAITGVNIGTCKSKIHYLINKLRKELEGL